MFFLKHPTTLEVLGVLRHPASEQGQQLRENDLVWKIQLNILVMLLAYYNYN